MPVVVVGLNHKSAPVEIRERLAFGPDRIEDAYAGLRRRAAECVILSTCNRTELYAEVAHAPNGIHLLTNFLARFNGIEPQSLQPHIYSHEGAAAAEHLFSVASGIDSMIVGEPQILGQVREAFEAAGERGAVGTVLSWVFSHALKAGKQVRTDTAICRNAVSVSYAAVEMARTTFGTLNGRTVLVVGAGKMGELAAGSLTGAGPEKIIVTNRTYSKAVELAERFGGVARDFAQLPQLVAESDIVLCSTGAPGFVITRALVAQAMFHRPERPLLVVDIAVPRDADPAIGDIDGVCLRDIDDLEAVVAGNILERRKEIAQAKAIIEIEVQAFQAWWETLEVVPTITALRRHAEEIRQQELSKALGRLGGLDERERGTLDALTSAIVNKLLHDPITRLKTEASSGNGTEYVRAVKDLFALEEAQAVPAR